MKHVIFCLKRRLHPSVALGMYQSQLYPPLAQALMSTYYRPYSHGLLKNVGYSANNRKHVNA